MRRSLTRSQAEATRLHEQLDARLADCGLQLHPEKTRIVCCSGRRGAHENVKFDFLGYTFQPRAAKNRSGRLFVSFLPAMSRAAMKSIRQIIRGWRLHRKSESSLKSLAKLMTPSVRGSPRVRVVVRCRTLPSFQNGERERVSRGLFA